MKRTSIHALSLLLALLASPCATWALELTTCIDAAERTVEGLSDPTLPVLVRAGRQGDKPVMRYNSEVLPQLSTMARAFFFAHSCARLQTGNGPDAVRRADCAAVRMLREEGTLGEGMEALASLQAELAIPDEAWAQLPGPQRHFDFSVCSRTGSLLLPDAKPVTPRQRDWDVCVRHCGDQLYRCPGRGSGAGCQETYDRCYAACGG